MIQGSVPHYWRELTNILFSNFLSSITFEPPFTNLNGTKSLGLQDISDNTTQAGYQNSTHNLLDVAYIPPQCGPSLCSTIHVPLANLVNSGTKSIPVPRNCPVSPIPENNLCKMPIPRSMPTYWHTAGTNESTRFPVTLKFQVISLTGKS